MRATRPRRALLGLGWNDPIKRAVRWAVSSPFRTARWVYGPYGLSTLPLQLGLERAFPAGGV
ncbi:MAG: hypothetical protein LBJ87_15125, partial [bacterium]|nr:hypothetical protein [bacterium]